MQNKVLIFIFFAGSIFLFAPMDKAKAEQYGCIKDNICTNLTATDILDFRTKCRDFCGTPIGPNCKPTLEACQPQPFGCWSGKDASCKPIVSDSIDKADEECTASCESGYECAISPVPCPPAKVYGCENVAGTECTNSVESDFTTADNWCKSLCASCHLRTNICPDVSALGTGVGSLQESASSKLNKAKFKTPTDLINRVIQLMMAFIGSIALVLYIVSGFMWMTASGNAERVTKAKSTMVWTTLGVVMMMASYMLASFIFKSLGV